MATEPPGPGVLRDIRVALFLNKVTHAAVAAQSGLSTSAVSRRLNGEVPATLDELAAFAAAADATLKVELVIR